MPADAARTFSRPYRHHSSVDERIAPKHLFALGYGGNGMTTSFLAAQLLLARYQRRPAAEERHFAFNRYRKRSVSG
jgi:glycine/D-amino acid oxidase-like deaminating enzyme